MPDKRHIEKISIPIIFLFYLPGPQWSWHRHSASPIICGTEVHTFSNTGAVAQPRWNMIHKGSTFFCLFVWHLLRIQMNASLFLGWQLCTEWIPTSSWEYKKELTSVGRPLLQHTRPSFTVEIKARQFSTGRTLSPANTAPELPASPL